MLAVAFLLAALQSVNLTDLLTQENVTVLRTEANSQTLIVKEGESIKTVKLSKKTVTGSGRRVGEVFRLEDGRLVYVDGRRRQGRRPDALTVDRGQQDGEQGRRRAVAELRAQQLVVDSRASIQPTNAPR